MAIIMTNILDIIHHVTLIKIHDVKDFLGVTMSKISFTINKS